MEGETGDLGMWPTDTLRVPHLMILSHANWHRKQTHCDEDGDDHDENDDRHLQAVHVELHFGGQAGKTSCEKMIPSSSPPTSSYLPLPTHIRNKKAQRQEWNPATPAHIVGTPFVSNVSQPHSQPAR